MDVRTGGLDLPDRIQNHIAFVYIRTDGLYQGIDIDVTRVKPNTAEL